MKKSFKIILVFILIIVIICTLYINIFDKKAFEVRLNWNLKLPFEDLTVYHKNSPPSFTGDGPRYAILKYTSKSKIKRLNSISWNSNKDLAAEDEVKQILSELEIDEKHMIPFNQNYIYYHCVGKDDKRDQIYMFYFVDENLIYIVEYFM